MKKRNTVLWEIKRSETSESNYLMGTMHLKDEKAYRFVELAEKYILKAEIYAGEMNLDEAESANLHQYFQLSEGVSIQDFYTKRQFDRMNKIFQKVTGVPLTELSNLTPMAISNILAESFVEDSYSVALDQQLWNYAANHNMILGGLESVQDQIEILRQIPIKDQVISLKRTLQSITKHRRYIHTLCDLYAQGEIHKLYRKSKKTLGALKPLMLYNRNRRMVEAFVTLSEARTLFAAVGAAHLSGINGMLHLLQIKGYTVRPISNS